MFVLSKYCTEFQFASLAPALHPPLFPALLRDQAAPLGETIFLLFCFELGHVTFFDQWPIEEVRENVLVPR